MNVFMDIKKNLRTVARNAAFRVEFLTSGREILLYTNAIYSAMMWGWTKRIEEKEKETHIREELIVFPTQTKNNPLSFSNFICMN